MAPDRAKSTKRKRSSTIDSKNTTPRSTPRKRQKKTDKRQHEQPAGLDQSAQPASVESDPFYEARAILKETKNKYLIDWENDRVTGEVYQPTWEPKRNANKLLVEDWKCRKLGEQGPKQQPQQQEPTSAPSPAASAARPQTDTSGSPAPTTPSAAAPKRKSHAPKRRRIVQSSSPSPEPEPEADSVPVNSPALDESRVIPETELRETRQPAVIVTQPTDFNPSDYERFSASQIPWGSSQAAPASSPQLQQTDFTVNSSQAPSNPHTAESYNVLAEKLLRQPLFGKGAIVPDSQSLPGDSSFAPSTQTCSGAEGQLAQIQAEQTDSAATRAQQDSSASASAQFTNSREADSSAPIPETDPIEEVPSSPAAPSHNEEQFLNPLQRESPWQSASSASSPPPTESPDKSTQSQTGSGNPQPSLGDQGESQARAAHEHTQDLETDADSRALSPKSRPQEQRQATTERFLEDSVAERTTQESEAQVQESVCVPNSIEQRAGSQDQGPSDQQTETGTKDQEHNTSEQEDGGQDHAQENHALPEIAETNEQEPVDGEQTGDQENAPDLNEESGESAEAQNFLTCPEKSSDNGTEPSGSSESAKTPPQDLAEVSVQDVTENSPNSHRSVQDFVVSEQNHHASAPVLNQQEDSEQTDLQHNSDHWQAAQYVPELDLDRLQTESSGSRPSDHANTSRNSPSKKRKDSSQDSAESGVLSQTDPNVVRHPFAQADSYVPTPKDIVPSIEGQTEQPYRGGYCKRPRGMPQTPQPANSSTGGPDQSNPQLTLTEKLRKLQADNKAERERKKAELEARYNETAPKSPSLEASTRSPSAIPPHGSQPAMEPQHTLMPSNLSAEAHIDAGHLPDAQDENSLPEIRYPASDTEMPDDSSPSVLLDEPIIGEAEYLIGLSMEGLQGDQYRREIAFKADAITKFTEDDSPDEQVVHEIHDLLKKVDNVITHMDLGFANADALTQYDNSADGMVAWSNNSSTKFRFLGGVLDNLRHLNLHFVILSRPGTLMDIVEKFVGGMGVAYSLGGNVNRQAFEAENSLFVTILSTELEHVDEDLPAADLIFTMDSTFRCQDPKTRALRNNLRGRKDSIPVITPIVTNSLEHVERCISSSLQGTARTKLVVRFMAELRQLAGRVEVSTKADHAVKLIVPSIDTDLDHHEAWPLPRVASIKDDVHFDESMISSLSVSSSVPVGTMTPSAGQKRHLEIEDEDSAKRARMTPQPEPGTINPNDITCISETVPGVSQSHGLSSNSILDEHIKTYRKDEKLRKQLKSTQERLKEFEDALTLCQGETEMQKQLILDLKRENTELKLGQVNAADRIRTQNATLNSLRNERSTLKEQLGEARGQLESSSIPEVAEREQLRRERDEALAKLERAQKARETENKESEFFRSQYQEASNQATALSTEVTTLTQQMREFEKLASGERERARKLTLETATNTYKEEVDRLTVQLRDREELIKQKNDEIKAIRGRQGVGTRAGSVPRSPRITGGGPGSRGGSPAPSGLGHGGRLGALRNFNA